VLRIGEVIGSSGEPEVQFSGRLALGE
jgi:hypothetical protein